MFCLSRQFEERPVHTTETAFQLHGVVGATCTEQLPGGAQGWGEGAEGGPRGAILH